MATKTLTVGGRDFTLDMNLAESAFAEKRIVGGRISDTFNLLPLKYPWAYDLYRTMKSNHWEPEDIPMAADIDYWKNPNTPDIDRWIIRMGVGYFSAAEGIVGDNVLHVVRELVTAPELKLVLGRHTHEENIHADSLLYMISSLGINPHECAALFESMESIKKKNDFVRRASMPLRNNADMTKTENLQALAKNMFVYGACMEGTQFYGLFTMILSLYRQKKFPGIGQMFRYTLRDECNHIENFRQLFTGLIQENPQIWTPQFREDLRATMKEALDLEIAFITDCLPKNTAGITLDDIIGYVKYVANIRMANAGLEPLEKGLINPCEWMDEMIFIRKEQNFFEGRVTEYKKASSLTKGDDADY